MMAEESGKLTEFIANLAWDFAVKEGFRIFKSKPTYKPHTRAYHTQASPRSLLSPTGTRSYSSVPEASPSHATQGALIISPEGLSPRVRELYDRLRRFMEQRVYPLESELQRHQASADRWRPSPLIEDLKVRPPVREPSQAGELSGVTSIFQLQQRASSRLISLLSCALLG